MPIPLVLLSILLWTAHSSDAFVPTNHHFSTSNNIAKQTSRHHAIPGGTTEAEAERNIHRLKGTYILAKVETIEPIPLPAGTTFEFKISIKSTLPIIAAQRRTEELRKNEKVPFRVRWRRRLSLLRNRLRGNRPRVRTLEKIQKPENIYKTGKYVMEVKYHVGNHHWGTKVVTSVAPKDGGVQCNLNPRGMMRSTMMLPSEDVHKVEMAVDRVWGSSIIAELCENDQKLVLEGQAGELHLQRSK